MNNSTRDANGLQLSDLATTEAYRLDLDADEAPRDYRVVQTIAGLDADGEPDASVVVVPCGGDSRDPVVLSLIDFNAARR